MDRGFSTFFAASRGHCRCSGHRVSTTLAGARCSTGVVGLDRLDRRAGLALPIGSPGFDDARWSALLNRRGVSTGSTGEGLDRLDRRKARSRWRTGARLELASKRRVARGADVGAPQGSPSDRGRRASQAVQPARRSTAARSGVRAASRLTGFRRRAPERAAQPAEGLDRLDRRRGSTNEGSRRARPLSGTAYAGRPRGSCRRSRGRGGRGGGGSRTGRWGGGRRCGRR